MQPQAITLTAQMLFDSTILHLLSQRGASRRGSGCAYYGGDGRRCAVGFHINENEYHTKMEGMGVGGLEVAGLLPDRLQPYVTLLGDFQVLHDRFSPFEISNMDFVRRVSSIAEKHGLSPAVITAPTP